MESTTAASPPRRPDVEKVFPGYLELAQLRQWASDVRHRIAALTEQLTALRKAASNPAQKTRIHQLNNALHRASYERDRVLEKYRAGLADLVEEATVDWMRIKSAWRTTEDHAFYLHVLQAKCLYLQQGKELFESDSVPSLATVAELEKELDRFANANLPNSALFDDPLLHFDQLVVKLSTVLVAAYNEAVDPPPWRSILENPTLTSMSYLEIGQAAETISKEIAQISDKIRDRRNELPGGIWRLNGDLRPEIYGFACLFYPEDPLHHIDVRETLLYLADEPDCALRRARLATLREDEAQCKKLLETYGRQIQLIEGARFLAREGNYRRAADSLRETEMLFSDLDYNVVEQEALGWKQELIEIDQQLSHYLDQAEGLLERVFRRLWFGFGTLRTARGLLSKVSPIIAEKTRFLQNHRGTDFHQDMEALLTRLRERLEKLIKLHRKAERFLQFISLGSAVGFVGMSILAMGLILNSIEMQHGEVTVTISPLFPGEKQPTIFFGGEIATGPVATFQHLRAGTYHLAVTTPGYEPYSRALSLLPAQKISLPPIELVPLCGFLRLGPSSGPYRYEVRRAGQDSVIASGSVGLNESAGLRFRPGRYAVHLVNGHKDYQAFLDISLNQVCSYSPDFEFSRVKITSEPQGAIVSLNGNDLGFTPLELSLPPIDQSLSLRMEGFETYYLPVKPQGGAPLAVQVTLYHIRPKPNPPPPDNTSIPPAIPIPAEGVENN